MSETQTESEPTKEPSDDGYQDNLHIEPVYAAFVCPLSKIVMKDPVILGTGHTFEREEIQKWFSDLQKNGKNIICPTSQKELESTYLTPNIVIRDNIEEWSRRNQAAQLNLARMSLSPGSSEVDILQALEYIQKVCLKSRNNKHSIRNAKVIPKIIDNLASKSSKVPCKALETLRTVVEDDDENKEAMTAGGSTVRTIVKFLNSKSPYEREAAVSLLYELSKSESLSEKIGDVKGAILILLGMSSSRSQNLLIVEKTNKMLENLGKIDKNVLQMAENGRLQPLLRHLTEGSPETQLGMASYLGELALTNDQKDLVAEIAGSSLLNLMKDGSKKEKGIALKALNQVASHKSSAEILLEQGILPPLVKDLLTFDNKEITMSLKEISANILAKITAYSSNISNVTIDDDQNTLTSENTIRDILHLISNTGPAIECKLLEILIGLTSTPTTAENVVSAIRTSGAVINLIQFIEAPQTDLRMASMKLLHNISPYMGQDLANSLCESAGYFCKLMEIISQSNTITEEQAASIGILAELPDKDLKLIQQFMHEKAFDTILSQILKVRRGEVRGGHRVAPYLEGLTQVLSKLIFNFETLPNTLAFAREKNIATLFSDLLQTNGMDNVQVASAKALRNLSEKSKRFARTIVSPSCIFPYCPWSKKKHVSTFECPVHNGYCSLNENFCLVEGKVVDKLVSCLDNPNEKVVEAAMAALCTLLQDGLNIEQAIIEISKVHGKQLILQVLRDSKTDYLQYKAVFAVERMLRVESIAEEISTDQSIDLALKQAYTHGHDKTKKIAERALKHTNKLADHSVIVPTKTYFGSGSL